MCSRCRSFHPDPTDKRIPPRFGPCAHLPVWHFMPPVAPCHFTPSRFQEAA
jgi:hypothetical protein